jgi:nuclear transport factor 2 (NTF2) superfamily protein
MPSDTISKNTESAGKSFIAPSPHAAAMLADFCGGPRRWKKSTPKLLENHRCTRYFAQEWIAMSPTPIKPPFNEETARQKVQAAEDAWNSKDPDRVSLAYTEDSDWRNRDEFFQGRDAIRAFLQRKWAKELDYRLKKELWAFRENRIAVRFEYEWHDTAGRWFRSYGNEMWEFDDDGLMRKRFASINDVVIQERERRIR